MKTNKKLTPRNAAPVKRENVATVSNDGNAIAPQESKDADAWYDEGWPFAGDDAE